MVFELFGQDINRVSKIIVAKNNVIFNSVIHGNNPGWVFVDDIYSPKTALIFAHGIKGFCFVGENNHPVFLKSILEYIDSHLVARLKELGIFNFEVSGETEDWCCAIENLFQNRTFKKSYQKVLRYSPHSFKNILNNSHITSDYSLLEVNKALFEINEIKNIDILHKRLISFWGSLEAYYLQGFGYCMIDKNKIVSLCLSGFVCGHIHSVEIETFEGYKRQNLAKEVLKAFLIKCESKHQEPLWDCMDQNIASIKLAKSVGFHLDSKYSLYSIDL